MSRTATQTRQTTTDASAPETNVVNRAITQVGESKNYTLAKDVYKKAGPTICKALEKVLDNEELGASRAYILADWIAGWTGREGSQNTYMLGKRAEASGVKELMGRLAAKIRKTFCAPLHDEFKGVVNTTEEEDNDFDF